LEIEKNGVPTKPNSVENVVMRRVVLKLMLLKLTTTKICAERSN
jgi:hypothetical protein